MSKFVVKTNEIVEKESVVNRNKTLRNNQDDAIIVIIFGLIGTLIFGYTFLNYSYTFSQHIRIIHNQLLSISISVLLIGILYYPKNN